MGDPPRVEPFIEDVDGLDLAALVDTAEDDDDREVRRAQQPLRFEQACPQCWHRLVICLF
ncbi:MAG: hypothetical protein U1E35_04310 [Rhodospirillales bacterium]